MKPKRNARAKAIDRRRINLEQAHEVRYWTQALDIDEQMLRDTVEQFGNRVKDVREAIEQLHAMRRASPRSARCRKAGYRRGRSAVCDGYGRPPEPLVPFA